jgi:hypothetical protein
VRGERGVFQPVATDTATYAVSPGSKPDAVGLGAGVKLGAGVVVGEAPGVVIGDAPGVGGDRVGAADGDGSDVTRLADGDSDGPPPAQPRITDATTSSHPLP